jgi:hypothetical protein
MPKWFVLGLLKLKDIYKPASNGSSKSSNVFQGKTECGKYL